MEKSHRELLEDFYEHLLLFNIVENENMDYVIDDYFDQADIEVVSPIYVYEY